jgi:AraC-like DNA-binding protein
VSDLVTLRRQASPTVGVRVWHNQRPEMYGGAAAHQDIEIAWTEGGSPPEYVVGSKRMTLHPTSVVVIPALVEHVTWVAPGTRAKVLTLSQSTVEEVADAMAVRPDLRPTLSTTQPRLGVLCQLIFEEAALETAGHAIALEALTEALAVELLRSDSPRPAAREARPTDLRIRRAIGFIEASFAEALSLETIAKVAGMSRFHFGRVFEGQVGKSPYRYLVDVRIARAADLLRGGRVSVTEAAISVGYNDLGRFGRAFRARFGVTPSQALAAARLERRSLSATPLGAPSRQKALAGARVARFA